MTTPREQIAQLEAAIAAQEALRPSLGDQVVGVALGAMLSQLGFLRAQAADSSSTSFPQDLRIETLLYFR